MAPSTVLGSSLTPTQNNAFQQSRSISSPEGVLGAKDGLYPPSRVGKDGRSLSNTSIGFGLRGASLAPFGQPPGSFSSDMRSVGVPRSGTPRIDLGGYVNRDDGREEGGTASEIRQAEFRDKIKKETKIKIGSENLLEALASKNAKQTRDQRLKVESELNSSNRKIAELKSQLEEEIQRAKRPATPNKSRLSSLFRGSPLRSPSRAEENGPAAVSQDNELETESPTYVLADILQALEMEGMQPDYYVERANSLVELFKRHPTLKYDLAWSIFGLRIQMMLLSDSREVVAAGYRLTRYAIADRKSLQTIRELHTDELVVLSLVKESKASIEREQALKFVRAFLDVKDGVRELSNAVVRTVVSVAEHYEDRLRSMGVLTLVEILIREPSLVVNAGGIGSLTDALAEGNYHGSESLVAAFLHLLDTPHHRKLLRSGFELEAAFSPFTDPLAVHGHEEKLRTNARSIAAMLKSWPGIFTLSRQNFMSIRSLLLSLYYPAPLARDIVLELVFDVLHIKPPSWSSSFLAGRRLTTYGRVANLKAESTAYQPRSDSDEGSSLFSLVGHYTSLVLAVLIDCGLLKALSDLVEDAIDFTLRRKAILLLGEVMKLANHSLPSTLSADLQILPRLLAAAAKEDEDSFSSATGTVYQIDSVNRTLYRSGLASRAAEASTAGAWEVSNIPKLAESGSTKLSVEMDDLQFRSLLLETQVLNTVNYLKWKWDLINDLVDGPLLNPKRLLEAISATKFLKRLIGFFRPFKYRFSDIKSTKPNQRYVRTGCALLRTLLKSAEGTRYLAESKLLRQLAECLAQLDRTSGLTSESPLFSPYRVTETLTGGYFALLGVLSSDSQGLLMIERWRMINMFYHIVELRNRDDLVQVLLGNMDFSLDSHLRVMLSKALTACPNSVRIFSTKLLRKYATRKPQESTSNVANSGDAEWAIRLLVTQLYDPEVEVCEVAVQILEEACNQLHYLEYVVRCRPALDHLGEIGAPLLLRFLSTSLGYQYLDGLDYITQEMDDWFLGRNDSYVTLVEASLSRALLEQSERPMSGFDEFFQRLNSGMVPPHFYRELTRTTEGCELLKQSGHFDDFVATIQDFWSESEDPETMLKVKGCLWAIGNVGSMELGAPFLEDTDVVTWIVKIAVKSEVTTMRGTAFFVLGLISRSLHGTEILAEHGWDTAADTLGQSLGYCLPPNLGVLFSLDLSRPTLDEPLGRRTVAVVPKATALEDDPINARILGLIVDLGNTVLTKRAATDLHIIKSKKAENFSQIPLFRKVMRVLEDHTFRLPVRRFVIDLFDKSVMRHIVLEDDASSDEDLDGEQA
ncbi:hypothetical protein MMC08_001434 [Hypocenomyce scalaris]|nr:hypothetical protein [Hypocenomyce scalaris]